MKNFFPMRVLYLVYVLIFFIAVLPVMIGISCIIWLFCGLPIFFAQERIGYLGIPFVMYKFRTMIPEAERLQRKYRRNNEINGPAFKIYDDPRFTRVGRFLSHTGLDELPQIWNIILGDMAFFGPRPLPVAEAAKLQKWQKQRQLIKPGILSPWVLRGYHKRSFQEWMKDDCEYVHIKDFWYDVQLFFQSLFFMMKLFFRESVKGMMKLIQS